MGSVPSDQGTNNYRPISRESKGAHQKVNNFFYSNNTGGKTTNYTTEQQQRIP